MERLLQRKNSLNIVANLEYDTKWIQAIQSKHNKSTTPQPQSLIDQTMLDSLANMNLSCKTLIPETADERVVSHIFKQVLKNVIRHLPTDTTEEPHDKTGCANCGKTFDSRAHLFAHIRKYNHALFTNCQSMPLIKKILLEESPDEALSYMLDIVSTIASRNPLLASKVVSTPTDSGDTPIIFATIKFLLAPETQLADWSKLILLLVQYGADPYKHPIVRAVRENAKRTTETSKDLSIWGLHFQLRGSAIEIANFYQNEYLVNVLLSKVDEGTKPAFSSLSNNAVPEPVHKFKFVQCLSSDCTKKARNMYELTENAYNLASKFMTKEDVILYSVEAATLEKKRIARALRSGGVVIEGKPARVVCHACSQTWCSACHLLESKHSSRAGWLSCMDAQAMEFVRTAAVEHGKGKSISEQILAANPALNYSDKMREQIISVLCTIQQSFQQTPEHRENRVIAVRVLLEVAPHKITRCFICDEPYDTYVKEAACVQSQIRVIKTFCTHTSNTCQHCWGAWVKSHVEQGKTNIKCIEPDCQVFLYPDDVERVSPNPQVYANYMALMVADYKGRLLQVLKSKLGFEKDPESRPCPKCRVILHRISGCDDFICNCSFRFNFVKAKWPTIKELEEEIREQGATHHPRNSKRALQPRFQHQRRCLCYLDLAEAHNRWPIFVNKVPQCTTHGKITTHPSYV